MEDSTRASTKTESEQQKESTPSQTRIFTWANGGTISSMEKDFTHTSMVISIKESSKRE